MQCHVTKLNLSVFYVDIQIEFNFPDNSHNLFMLDENFIPFHPWWIYPAAMQQKADGHWVSEVAVGPLLRHCNAPWVEHHLRPAFYGVVKMTRPFQAVGAPTIDITLLSSRVFYSNNLNRNFSSMSTLRATSLFYDQRIVQIKSQTNSKAMEKCKWLTLVKLEMLSTQASYSTLIGIHGLTSRLITFAKIGLTVDALAKRCFRICLGVWHWLSYILAMLPFR